MFLHMSKMASDRALILVLLRSSKGGKTGKPTFTTWACYMSFDVRSCHTVDGRNPKQPPGMALKPCK